MLQKAIHEESSAERVVRIEKLGLELKQAMGFLKAASQDSRAGRLYPLGFLAYSGVRGGCQGEGSGTETQQYQDRC